MSVWQLDAGSGHTLRHLAQPPHVDPSVPGARHHQVPDDPDAVHAGVVGVGADLGRDGVTAPEACLLLPGDTGAGPVDISRDCWILSRPSLTHPDPPGGLVLAQAQEPLAHFGQNLYDELCIQVLENVEEDLFGKSVQLHNGEVCEVKIRLRSEKGAKFETVSLG